MTPPFYRLDTPDQTLVLMTAQGCMPQLLYWGDALALDCDLQALARARAPALPHGGLDAAEIVSWLPEAGRGFTDAPGLALRRGERHLYTQFSLHRAEPSEHAWIFELGDAAAGLELSLSMRLHAGSGVFSADARLRNVGSDLLSIDAMATWVMPVPRHFTEQQSLGGRWAGEFQARREALGHAGWLQESRVGRSSHHAYPGLVAMAPGTTATQGEAMSVQLAWSGNHRLLLQRLRLGGVQLQVGELLLPGEAALAPGHTHTAPTVHLARSDQGLRKLSLRWHRFVRGCIVPPLPPPRLVQFNTWEATYFDHDRVRLCALAERAAVLGVERFILDDGWFAARRHDRAGLGDWVPCPERYPDGLAPLAAHCQRLGLQFGLWVEPEGVNADSDLYRAHPDWLLGVPGLPQPLGRHQYVLNLGLPAARDHVFSQLSTLLHSAPIGYLKWDMNRDMTHAAGPDGHAAARAHVLGLYRLIDDLRCTFPGLEIESCASGGARADLGLLARSSRIWVSDNNDPLERQPMQRALLGFLPPELMGVHVGDARSHTTGRVAAMPLRTLNALFGHFGIEADVLALNEADARHLTAAIAVYKMHRDWLHTADVTPIDHPDPAVLPTLALAADGQRAFISVVAVARPLEAISAPLRLPGLDPQAHYQVSLHPLWQPATNVSKTLTALQQPDAPLVLSGQVLWCSGVALPVLQPNSALLLDLRRVTP